MDEKKSLDGQCGVKLFEEGYEGNNCRAKVSLEHHLHWRSGRVAFPRVKVVLLMAAALLAAVALRRAERAAAVERRSAPDMVCKQ